MTSIAVVCREIDQLLEVDFRSGELLDMQVELGVLTRENDDLRDQLGRSEDRRYQP